MAQKKSKEEGVGCPVGKFFKDMDDAWGRKSKFFEHMRQSRIEFLKGIRSLVDERIDHLEKSRKRAGRKMTNIKVE